MIKSHLLYRNINPDFPNKPLQSSDRNYHDNSRTISTNDGELTHFSAELMASHDLPFFQYNSSEMRIMKAENATVDIKKIRT